LVWRLAYTWIKKVTSSNFAIEPGFTLNAELQQRKKGETEVLLEWPPILSES